MIYKRIFLPFFLLSIIWVESGCYVKSKCYRNSDCDPPGVCREGKCILECKVHEDCDEVYGNAYVCKDNLCVYPTECLQCHFNNAKSSCVHGECIIGECSEGYYDINGKKDDGCEYSCSISNHGIEICDDKDNDCNGKIDEIFDKKTDKQNCGRCANVCTDPPHATGICASGSCTFSCDAGWFDNNGNPLDGCESPECVPVDEVCDGRDNDCDCGSDTNGDTIVCGPGDEGVDEGFNKTLPESCGSYCIKCNFQHATALCIGGFCQMGECNEGYFDIDQIEATGCEYECYPSGEEICDSADNDCDGFIDEDNVCGTHCPPDMVSINNAFCIDKYEASRSDATAESPGTDNSIATSRPGVLPWMVNPMTQEKLTEFESACNAAGKRLCTREEWFATCTGPSGSTYFFGNTFDRETCNSVDTYCDDYCLANGIPFSECNTGTNCGYTYNCFHVDPTGIHPGCTNEYGAFDVNGNVWEVVLSTSDPRGYEVKGGAFNCASPAVRFECTFNAGWNELFAGFRCCKNLD